MTILSDEKLAEQTKHSPVPWSYSPQDGGLLHCLMAQVWNAEGSCLATIEPSDNASANAALIVEAVNNHARLKAENAALVKALHRIIKCAEIEGHLGHCADEARSALSKATGG